MLVGDETSWIDEDFARLQLRLENVGKYLQAGKNRVVLRGDVDADRACQIVVNIQTEQPNIVGLVVLIGKPSAEVRRNRPFPQIGVVAQAVNLIALIVGLDQTVINLVQQLRNAVGKTRLCAGQRKCTHTQPPRRHHAPVR